MGVYQGVKIAMARRRPEDANQPRLKLDSSLI